MGKNEAEWLNNLLTVSQGLKVSVVSMKELFSYHVSREPNLDCQACVAGALLTKPSVLPSLISKITLVPIVTTVCLPEDIYCTFCLLISTYLSFYFLKQF